MRAQDVVIVGAARTPIGRYGGSLKDVHPAELGAVAVRAALRQAGVDAAEVEEVLVGQGRQAGSGPNPARQVGHRAGLPVAAPAQTINKACASGLQAIVAGAQSILLGESAVVVAGGIESMSRMPYLVDAADARWGHKMGHFAVRGRDVSRRLPRPVVGADHGRDRGAPRPELRHHARAIGPVRAREPAQGGARQGRRPISPPRSRRSR